MKIKIGVYPLSISKRFVSILDRVIKESKVDAFAGVIINFRDPNYSSESGGYHPVEIMINSEGIIQYITDFAYFGKPPYAELGKELDFDVSAGIFGYSGRDYPIAEGRGIYRIFQSNFCDYHDSGIFRIEVNPL
jgi:hypothetical protein